MRMDSVTAVSRIEGWTSRRIRVVQTPTGLLAFGAIGVALVMRHNTVKCLPVCVLADGGESDFNQAEKKKTPGREAELWRRGRPG